jgi:hypothetical protein
MTWSLELQLELPAFWSHSISALCLSNKFFAVNFHAGVFLAMLAYYNQCTCLCETDIPQVKMPGDKTSAGATANKPGCTFLSMLENKAKFFMNSAKRSFIVHLYSMLS